MSPNCAPRGRSSCRPNTSSSSVLFHNFRESSEEYRSVIDDLTIENKLLKRKLERYERLRCTHLQHEQLFEVRIHGLPDPKKRDLERVLREYTAGLDEPAIVDDAADNHGCSSQQGCQAYTRPKADPTPVDSAYASTAASENTLNNRLKLNGAYTVARTPSVRVCQKTMGSDIPDRSDCFILSQPICISESSKKKAVVKRLEQLFTGKPAAFNPGNSYHQHDELQPGVTRDRHTVDVRPTPEGAREARISPTEMDCQINGTVNQSQSLQSSGSRPSLTGLPLSDISPRQRPTRPIDLDIHQTQDSTNNMKYIRHLGFDVSTPHSGVTEVRDGWVYLNLLMSMAQLHTLNVTQEFVRKAVIDMSSKFEFSPDGQQVRWLGGLDESASEVSSEEHCPNNPETSRSAASSTSPEKSTSSPYASGRGNGGLASISSGQVFHCNPICAHRSPGNDQDISCESLQMACHDYDSAATNPSYSADAIHSSNWAIQREQRKADSGPIIFYSNPFFCTDLSGNASYDCGDGIQYLRCSLRPLGSSDHCATRSGPGGLFEKRGPLSQAIEAVSDNGSSTSVEVSLEFPDMDALSLGSNHNGPQPVLLEASGLSGIQPEDNFMIDVQIQHACSGGVHPSRTVNPNLKDSRGPIGPRLHANGPMQPVSSRRVISSTVTDLAPSSLPSPSYICFPFSSSESEFSDSDSDMQEDELSSFSHQGDRQEANEPLGCDHISTSVGQPRAFLGRSAACQFARRDSEDSDGSSISLASSGRRFDLE